MRYRRRRRTASKRFTPQAALAQAADFIRLDPPEYMMAWETLHDLLVERRRRHWNEHYEKVVLKYLELSVELRKSPKDGLIQYRMICNVSKLQSLGLVLRQYMEMGEAKTRKVLEEFDSEWDKKWADKEAHPDGATTDDERYKYKNHPQLRFTFQYVYRCVLDILRNNAELDHLYQKTVSKTIEFLLRVNFTGQFKRLCDVVRRHLNAILDHQNQPNAVKINDPHTRSTYLRTRFTLLDASTQLSMWQEGFRLVGDIHSLMKDTDDDLEPALLTKYYQQLAKIFWKSDYYLFHAYAQYNYWEQSHLARERWQRESEKRAGLRKTYREPPITEEKLRELGQSVVLSAICVRQRDQNKSMDTHLNEQSLNEASQRLKFGPNPSRKDLMRKIDDAGLLKEASGNINRLFELDFSPVTFCEELEASINQLEGEMLLEYVDDLKWLALHRLLEQLSRVYSSLKLERIKTLSFKNTTIREIEKAVVQAVETNAMQARIDHRTGILVFSPTTLESPNLVTHLSKLAKSFQTIKDSIDADEIQAREVAIRVKVFTKVREGVAHEQQIINSRMNQQERERQDKEKMREEEHKKQEQQAQIDLKERRILEARQKQQLAAKIYDMKNEKEQAEKRTRKRMQTIRIVADSIDRDQNLGRNTKWGKQLRDKLKMAKAGGQFEQDELQRVFDEYKVTADRKKDEEMDREFQFTDYYTRALRMEEMPAIKERQKEEQRRNKKEAEEAFRAFKKEHKNTWVSEKGTKDMLGAAREGADEYWAKFEARKTKDYERAKKFYDQFQKDTEDKRNAEEKEKREREEAQEESRKAQDAKRERLQEENTKQDEKETLEREESAKEREATKSSRIQAAKDKFNKEQEARNKRMGYTAGTTSAPVVRATPIRASPSTPARGEGGDSSGSWRRAGAPRRQAEPAARSSPGGAWKPSGNRRAIPERRPLGQAQGRAGPAAPLVEDKTRFVRRALKSRDDDLPVPRRRIRKQEPAPAGNIPGMPAPNRGLAQQSAGPGKFVPMRLRKTPGQAAPAQQQAPARKKFARPSADADGPGTFTPSRLSGGPRQQAAGAPARSALNRNNSIGPRTSAPRRQQTFSRPSASARGPIGGGAARKPGAFVPSRIRSGQTGSNNAAPAQGAPVARRSLGGSTGGSSGWVPPSRRKRQTETDEDGFAKVKSTGGPRSSRFSRS